jgi:hypothetical protein
VLSERSRPDSEREGAEALTRKAPVTSAALDTTTAAASEATVAAVVAIGNPASTAGTTLRGTPTEAQKGDLTRERGALRFLTQQRRRVATRRGRRW